MGFVKMIIHFLPGSRLTLASTFRLALYKASIYEFLNQTILTYHCQNVLKIILLMYKYYSVNDIPLYKYKTLLYFSCV